MTQQIPLPSTNDLEATWKFLEDGIDQIYNRLEEGLTHARFMNLYTYAMLFHIYHNVMPSVLNMIILSSIELSTIIVRAVEFKLVNTVLIHKTIRHSAVSVIHTA
jgi:hypothetical protein